MPKIYNISKYELQTGNHVFIDHGVLIQITDVDGHFATPERPNDFEFVYQYNFNLVDRFESDLRKKQKGIQKHHADDIADVLISAQLSGRDVIVQCEYGEQRSGAIATVGSWIGFENDHIQDNPDTIILNSIADSLYDKGLL